LAWERKEMSEAMMALATWMRRSRRYEEALRLLTTEWVNDLSPTDIQVFAEDVLREEGRL